MARPVVGNPFDGQIGTVAPTARPVDTYVRGVVKKSPFEALSKTLNNLEKKAVPALQREEQRRGEKEFKEGQALYNTNRIAIGEAVKKGLIDEGESPYLRKGYRIAQMNTLGMRYTAELESALERQKLYTSGDPERIEKFVTEFQEKFVANNGMSDFAASELSEHFGVVAAKSNEVFRQSWQKKHVAWQSAQNYVAFEREVAEATISFFKPDMSDEERTAALGSFSTWLEAKAAAASTDGMNNEKVLNTILQGVGIAVQTTGQTDILEVFKRTQFGTGAAGMSLKVQEKMLIIESKALALDKSKAVAANNEVKIKYEASRAEAVALADKFNTDPSTKNKFALTDAIDALMATPSDKNTGLAADLRKQLRAAEMATLNGGLSKTAATEIYLENALMEARTYSEAISLIERSASHGELTPDDVIKKINRWRTQFDPALDDALQLDFYTSSTPEGDALANLKQIIRGNEMDYDSARLQRARIEAHKFKQQLRNGVQLFERENGRFPTDYELEDITYKVQQTIIERLLSKQILDEVEEGKR